MECQSTPAPLAPGVWTFDYPAQTLVLHATPWQPTPDETSAPLGFKTFANGLKNAWPRIRMTVDGTSYNIPLDTGATASPPPEMLAKSGMETHDGMGVTSYITRSTMDEWHRRHPEWLYLPKGYALLIHKPLPTFRVPEIEIAGWHVGPVWFTQQPKARPAGTCSKTFV